MDFLPRIASGMIFSWDATDGEPARFEGSGGCLTRRDVILTAAHCAPTDRELFIMLPGEQPAFRIAQQRSYHDTSDLAVLHAPAPANADQSSLHYFSNQVYQLPIREVQDGADYLCFGYPAGSSPDNPPGVDQPIGRTIKGNVQRWFQYSDGDNRSYLALELSTPAPGGLSGSVIAYTSRPDVAVGVVTANFDSYAFIDRVDDVEDGGKVYRETTQRVVSYGVAAWLAGKEEWLSGALASFPEE